MRWWEQQVGGATRGRIIALIRRGMSTIEELAAELGVTDNAVRAQIQTLEDADLVASVGTRQGAGAGKPATLYQITQTGEAMLSAAYAPVLTSLLESLADRLAPADIAEILRETGRRLVPADSIATGSMESRVRTAAAVLIALGAEIDVEKINGGFRLRGYACPLSAAVRAEPGACQVVEELVASLVGSPVRECCDRTHGARCRFEILSKVGVRN
ncbi:MAG: regulatory protein ArsR [Gemmatimonadetes bacterium]|nr:regulatory protein ArsR [Gemmatimonadota bacterium]